MSDFWLKGILRGVSGGGSLHVSEQLLFDKIIGFQSVTPSAGASMYLNGLAYALSQQTQYTVCVVDTNYIYPMLSHLLLEEQPAPTSKDLLDFSGNLEAVVQKTKYPEVYLVALNNRTFIDLLSSKDAANVMDALLDRLKSYFDIILIDLATTELSNIAIHAAIQCNKIYTVAEGNLKSIVNLKKSFNQRASLAVNFSKANNIILNKIIPSVPFPEKVVTDLGLNIVGEVPLSVDIALMDSSMKPMWRSLSKDHGVLAYSHVIDTIFGEIVQTTPMTGHLEAAKTEEEKTSWFKRFTKRNVTQLIENSLGSVFPSKPTEESIIEDEVIEDELIEDEIIEDEIIEDEIIEDEVLDYDAIEDKGRQ